MSLKQIIEDSDETPHYAASHLGLHCVPMYIYKDDRLREREKKQKQTKTIVRLPVNNLASETVGRQHMDCFTFP